MSARFLPRFDRKSWSFAQKESIFGEKSWTFQVPIRGLNPQLPATRRVNALCAPKHRFWIDKLPISRDLSIFVR